MAGDDWTVRIASPENGAALTDPLRHGGRVLAARFSLDGRCVLTFGDEGLTRVWDLAGTDRFGQRWASNMDSCTDLDAETGCFVIITPRSGQNARHGEPRIWRPEGDELRATVLAHDSPVLNAGFSPDGWAVATFDTGGHVRIWDAATRKPQTGALGHDQHVRDAAFSQDRRFLLTLTGAAFGPAGTLRVWSVADGLPVRPPLRVDRPIAAAAISPDGKRVVYSVAFSSDNKGTGTWARDLGSGKTAEIHAAGPAALLRFSPDARWLAAVLNEKGWILSTDGWQPVSEPFQHGRDIVSATFSPDSAALATAGDGLAVRLWQSRSEQPVSEPLRHQFKIALVEFSPDSWRLATATQLGRHGASYAAQFRVWDARSGRPLTYPQSSRADLVRVGCRPRPPTWRSCCKSTLDAWDQSPLAGASDRDLLDLAKLAYILDSSQTLLSSAVPGPRGAIVARPARAPSRLVHSVG